MSSEDDLNRYKRDQDLLFDQIEDKRRRSQAAKESDARFRNTLARLVEFNTLEQQLLDLGRLSGMSSFEAGYWAKSLKKEAQRLTLNPRTVTSRRWEPPKFGG